MNVIRMDGKNKKAEQNNTFRKIILIHFFLRFIFGPHYQKVSYFILICKPTEDIHMTLL